VDLLRDLVARGGRAGVRADIRGDVAAGADLLIFDLATAARRSPRLDDHAARMPRATGRAKVLALARARSAPTS
jgi:hypothetical protein